MARLDVLLLFWLCCLAAISSATATTRLVSVTRGSTAIDGLDTNSNRSINATICNISESKPLVLGMPASLSSKFRYSQFGQIQVAAQSLLVDYINGPERCGVDVGGGVRRTLELQYYDDKSSIDRMPEISNYLVTKNQSRADFVLGGYSSFLTGNLSNATDLSQRLMIAAGASDPAVYENRSRSFGILTRADMYLRSAIEAMASLPDGPRTLAVVRGSATSSMKQCSNIERVASQLGLEMVPNGTHNVPHRDTPVEEYETVARLLKEDNPDLVLTCLQECHKWVGAMRNVGWSPRAQVFTICVGTPFFQQAVGTDTEYMIGASAWHSTVAGRDAVTGWSSEEFTDLFLKESSHKHITYHAAAFATSISVLVQAIEQTQSLDESVLAEFIAGNTFSTIIGEIGFDKNGQNNKPMILIQYQNNNTIQTVYPEASQSAPLVYPMPTWEERDCIHLSDCGKGIDSDERCGRDGRCICMDDERSVPVGRGATAACNPKEKMNYIPDSVLGFGYFAFAVTMLAIALAAAWTYTYRYAWTVKVAQPMLLGFILLGCLISNLSILFMGVETGYNEVILSSSSSSDGADPLTLTEKPDITRVNASCMAVPWLYGIGFAVTFAALFVKIERVRLISLARKTEANTKLGFQHVVHIMAAVLALELIVLISWQVVSPFQWEREVILEENGFTVESVGACSSDHGAYFLVALMILHMLLLLFALVLAFQTRHIDEDFAESNSLAMVVAFMFQVMVLAIPIAILVNESKDIYYVVGVGVVFLQNMTVLCLMFIPKVAKNALSRDGERPPVGDAKEKIPLSSLTHCKWDEGVDLINEFLSRPDMSEDDRIRLSSLLKLVLRRNAKKSRKEEKLSYLPTKLLRSNKLNAMSSKFVMEEYGGVDISDETSVGESLVSSSTAHTRNSGVGQWSDTDFGSNAPAEFHSFDPKKQARLQELLSLTSLGQWDFNVFELDEETEGHPLLFMGWAILGSPHAQHVMAQTCGNQFTTSPSQFKGYFFTDKKKGFNIPMGTLCNYLRAIESDYKANNPYHNAIHAADVLQSLHALLRMMEASCGVAGVKPKLNREHLFAVLLGAAVHDVKHPGRSNAFQVNARTGHALVYNNDSVLENMHASHAFRIMLGLDECLTEESSPIKVEEDSSVNVMANMTRKQYDSVRSKMIEAILHTDMSKHFQIVATMKSLSLSTDEVGGNVAEQPSGPALFRNEENTWQLLMFLMHLADISNPAKPNPLFHKWTMRVLDEFFEQGDQETSLGLAISPLCDRATTKVADSQIGFVQFVVQPAFEVCGQLLPEVQTTVVPVVEENLRYWEQQKTKDKDI